MLLLSACTNYEQPSAALPDITPVHKTFLLDTVTNYAAQDTIAITKPLIKEIKNPSGIYQFYLPYKDYIIKHTVKFFNNNTYRLQEKYTGDKKDSVVISEGNWAPSNGLIWLYKDQVVRSRYKWKGNTLHYFNPPQDSGYTMQKLSDITENKIWKRKKKEGIVLAAIGNEPFWSLEFNTKDTLSFLLSEWKNPIIIKMGEANQYKDSLVYTAINDSAKIRVVILPYFCSDGMSDFTYPNKIKVQYNNQVFKGCGVLYQ